MKEENNKAKDDDKNNDYCSLCDEKTKNYHIC